MLTEPGYADHSVAEITDTADVGLGTFYNHFDSKAELFDVAVCEVLKEHGRLIDSLSADQSDIAVIVAVAIRSTARLVITNPQMARVLATKGPGLLEAEYGLAPRTRRGMEHGVSTGRFDPVDPELLMVAVGGALIGLLHRWIADPTAVDAAACDAMAERLLLMCGVPADEAKAIAHSPLPGDRSP